MTALSAVWDWLTGCSNEQLITRMTITLREVNEENIALRRENGDLRREIRDLQYQADILTARVKREAA